MQIDENKLRDLCQLNKQLLQAVRELTREVDKTEVDVLTIGNILIKKNIITKQELQQESRKIIGLKQKSAQQKSYSENARQMVDEFMNTVKENHHFTS